MRAPPATFTFAAVLLFAVSASATVVIAQSIEEMTRSAPLVVEGEVGQVQARWDDEGKRINTYAEVRVSQSLKGDPPATLVVRQPGGVVGNMGQRVAGAAQFERGERVILFLEPAVDEPSTFLVWAMAAGKFAVRANPMGELRAVRDLQGLSFYQRGVDGPERIRKLDLSGDLGRPEELRIRIRAALAPRGGAR